MLAVYDLRLISLWKIVLFLISVFLFIYILIYTQLNKNIEINHLITSKKRSKNNQRKIISIQLEWQNGHIQRLKITSIFRLEFEISDALYDEEKGAPKYIFTYKKVNLVCTTLFIIKINQSKIMIPKCFILH